MKKNCVVSLSIVFFIHFFATQDRHVKISTHFYQNQKFDRPPAYLLQELRQDNILDPWEVQPGQDPDYVPIIGILTQPTSARMKKGFNYAHYILEINHRFIAWSGSRTIAIPFDISDEDL